MIVHTGAGDSPQARGEKLTAAIAAYKMENEMSGSPLMGKLAGRYGTSGFSMGGGGTTFSAMGDPMLKSAVAIMAATEALWPRAVVNGPAVSARNHVWRFSGRWWSRPVPARRDRPYR